MLTFAKNEISVLGWEFESDLIIIEDKGHLKGPLIFNIGEYYTLWIQIVLMIFSY